MSRRTRRELLREAAGAAAALGAAGGAGSAAAGTAGEPLPVAVIGTGGMGSKHLELLAARKDVRLAYVCDPDAKRRAAAARTARELSGHEPKAAADLRQVLEDRAVQAVWIATPDHWHGPAAILAANAGKHVYVEKPCSHNIREGRLMIEAARRANRVMQVGTQSRSAEHIRKAIEHLRSGAIGEVLVAKAWNSQRRNDIGRSRPSSPPPELDYDLWVGPAPMVPFQSNRAHYTWHWWYDFGTGDMGNDGVHELDIARWGLGVESHPGAVTAFGGKYHFDDDQQFPDTQYVLFDYGGGGKDRRKQLVYEHRIWSPYGLEGYENGNAFYGTKGMMVLGKNGGWKIILEGNKPGPSMTGSPAIQAHHQDFLECIRTGRRPNADIEVNHLSTTLCHLGNIASRLNRTLRFDPQREQILGDEEAGKLVRRAYRPGHWAAPRGV